MDLDVSAYYTAVDGKNGIFEVTAAGVTDPARKNYVKPFAGISNRVPYQVVLPEARNNPFCNLHVFTRLRVYAGKKLTSFRWQITCYSFYSIASLLAFGVYLKPERSATRDSRVAEVPRGLYIPISHSLIVCWRVPSSSASLAWVSLICRRNARTPGPSHLVLCLF